MIWYRHWVEMRLGVLVFAGLCLWFGVTILGPWRSLEFGQALPLTPLGQAIGAERVLVWAEFAGRILPFSLAASLTLAGAGFRTFFMPVAPVVYTLTLPISRTRLIWTRLAAGLGVACVGATLLTAGGIVWFTMRGQTVPIAAVLQSLVLGVVVLAAMLAIMSAVITALPTAWAFLGILGLLALAIPNSYVVSAPARGDVPWLAVGGYVLALVAAMLFTLSYVRALGVLTRMLGATLYRHWLELRFLVLATLGPWLALCAVAAFLVVALPPAVSPVQVHAWALSMAVVLAGLVFGGTGIRSGLESAPRSVYYTLTLPVSRFMLTWTRLCTAAAIAFALVFGVFIAVVAALWSADHAVPLRALAASMLLGFAAAATTQALVGLVLPLVTERFSPALLSLIPVGVILAIVRTFDDRSTGWAHVVRFLEFQPERWDVIGALLLVIVCSLVTAAVLVRVRDF